MSGCRAPPARQMQPWVLRAVSLGGALLRANSRGASAQAATRRSVSALSHSPPPPPPVVHHIAGPRAISTDAIVSRCTPRLSLSARCPSAPRPAYRPPRTARRTLHEWPRVGPPRARRRRPAPPCGSRREQTLDRRVCRRAARSVVRGGPSWRRGRARAGCPRPSTALHTSLPQYQSHTRTHSSTAFSVKLLQYKLVLQYCSN